LQNGTVPPTKDVNKERSLFGFVRAIRPHSPTRQSTFDDVLPRSRLSFIKFFHRSGLPNKDSYGRIKAQVHKTYLRLLSNKAGSPVAQGRVAFLDSQGEFYRITMS
jgi:hypothetical protein